MVKVTKTEMLMRAREFHVTLSNATGATMGEVDQRTRFLRAIGHVQTGKRGPYAPDIEPVEAACMLLAMVSRRATESADIFSAANTLRAVPRRIGETEFLKDGPTLGAVLTSILASPGDWTEVFDVKRIEVEESGAFARLCLGSFDVLFSNDETLRDWVRKNPETYDSQFAGSARRCFVIGGALLDQIALELTEDNEAQWAEA